MNDALAGRAAGYVHELCRYPDRHPGRPGNEAANVLFERVVGGHGFAVASSEFDCLDWRGGDASLRTGGRAVSLHPGPYSLPLDASAPLSAAGSIEELEGGEHRGTVLLLHGPLAAGQLMPKNFPFYNPDSHRRIVAALEAQAPIAVLAATGRDPGMVGSQYPFPLIEDGDFDIPHAYLKDVEGEPLLGAAGEPAHVWIDSERIPARGRQLVARKSGTEGEQRVVVFAHIDSYHDAPGALDNASGVAALMLLAELLADLPLGPAVELVPLNGEDYYATPGHLVWLAANRGELDDIVLGMNVDDAGTVGYGTGISLYSCPPVIAGLVRGLIHERAGFIEGPQWPQGDHSLFVMNGVPALAFTSEAFMEVLATTAHTAADRPEKVDPAVVASVARFMKDVITGLD